MFTKIHRKRKHSFVGSVVYAVFQSRLIPDRSQFLSFLFLACVLVKNVSLSAQSQLMAFNVSSTTIYMRDHCIKDISPLPFTLCSLILYCPYSLITYTHHLNFGDLSDMYMDAIPTNGAINCIPNTEKRTQRHQVWSPTAYK